MSSGKEDDHKFHQNLQVASTCNPCLNRRAAVQSQPRNASQRKNITLDRAQDFQMSLVPLMDAAPRWRALYAEEDPWSLILRDVFVTCQQKLKVGLMLQHPLDPATNFLEDPNPKPAHIIRIIN